MRFSELDGASVGVWGAGREISSFADQLARRLPSARIAVAAFDAPPAPDVRNTLRAPDARILLADADSGAGDGADGRADAGAAARDALVAALSGCDVVVRSPGVSIYRRELQALRAAGTPVTTATSLWLAEHGGAGVIGVTGTKGKSTTAALAFHLARSAGRTALLAGNIGVPALDLLDDEPAEVTVLELSSYHTADLEIGPEVAVVTNLYREHADWHGSEQAYRADKLRVLGLPGVRVAVLSARDERLAELAPDVETIRYGQPGGWDALAAGVALGGGVALAGRGALAGRDALAGGVALRGELVAAADELPLRGEHNVLNLCAALAALEALGVAPAPLPGALDGFQPLPHRLEPVAERDGVAWVNDSISTTPESTIAALASFPGRELILIGGGQDRGQDYTQLADVLAHADATVIGVPSTGGRLLAAARAAGVRPARAIAAEDMREAVEIARALARSGTTVLLSPAAPSYDNYRDFEQRGERFRALAVSC
ncbi:MAG TPA: UDP-N-acetylmuramoyl-L-alanine--D-glutamate ligase [Solirubrobacteraceae bacterium]|nr:UDP-N-acetylmuramoyl-L-alanine--D-glutamate ligase [Solirubrobacteraceae bacterium]